MLKSALIAAATVIVLAGTLAPETGAQKRCPGGTSVGANQPCGPLTATARKEGKGTRSVPPGRITGLAADPSDPAVTPKCLNKANKHVACSDKLRANPAGKKAKGNKHLDVESWSWGGK